MKDLFFRGHVLNSQVELCIRIKSSGQALNTVPPIVDHRHDVGQVQAFYHHLHEIIVTSSTGHKLLQGELTC